MSILIVGDVHAVPQELEDCRSLMQLVLDTVNRPDIEEVIFLGDQHHNHNVLDSRCVDFWTKAINEILRHKSCTLLIGNHDFLSPTIMYPHSMVAHNDGAVIVDKPMSFQQKNYAAMPYYPDPVKFIEDADKLKEANPDVEILFCHQTFVGADEGKGFYSKDAVEQTAVPFKTIISGHIHKPMKLGKVLYAGAPRWRTLTDAEVAKRYIYVMDLKGKITPITTNTHCIKIYKFEDNQDSPADINLTEGELKLADIRVSISGTTDYISKRMAELKAKYTNVKCRGLPIRTRLAKAAESDGIDVAFKKFAGMFVPPNGSDKELLIKEAYGRLQ